MIAFYGFANLEQNLSRRAFVMFKAPNVTKANVVGTTFELRRSARLLLRF
jgi:hypothetical protein